MKNILKILSLILLFTFMVSCGGSKYETVDLTDFVYLKDKSAKIDVDEHAQMVDYGRRMLNFVLPIANLDSADYYMDDYIFSRFDQSIKDLKNDQTSSLHYLIGNMLGYLSTPIQLKYSTIKAFMDIIDEMDNYKAIKNNLVKPDYLVPYYLVKILYTHMLISSIGNDYTTEQTKIIDSELREYLELVKTETKEEPYYTKAKEVDKLFGTHIVDYIDMVRELAVEAEKKEYGARRPVWIFYNNNLFNKYYEINHSTEDEDDEKIYNLQYTDNAVKIEHLTKLMDQESLDFEKLKAKIQK